MRITVKGTREVEQALLALREEFSAQQAKRSVVPALRRAVKPALDAIRPAVPVDTGRLRVQTKAGAKVSTMRDRKRKYHSNQSIAYGFVIVGVNYVDLKGEFRPAAMALEYGRADQPATPFIRANFERAIPAMTQNLGAELAAQIDQFANKQRSKRA